MKIRFRGNRVRKLFFDKVKKKYSKSWKEVYKILDIPKSTFEFYRNGKFLLPEGVFDKLMGKIDGNSKRLIEPNIQKLSDNYGQRIGGKKAYKINFKKFEEGRKKGIHSLKRRRENDYSQLLSFLKGINNSNKICEFVGAFIGDGCFNFYRNKLYYIGFSGDSRYDVDYYKEVITPHINTVFPDIRPKFKYVKNKNSLQVIFHSKKLFCLLRDYFGFTPGKKTFTIFIPKKILDNDEFLRATIRGIYDTDGSVFFDKRKSYKSAYPRILLQIKSKPLYDQLVSYFSQHFSLYKRFEPKREIYIIEIYGKEQFKKWMSLIGFSNKRHLNRIASVAQPRF